MSRFDHPELPRAVQNGTVNPYARCSGRRLRAAAERVIVGQTRETMRLVAISVEKFRSIAKTPRVRLDKLTVLLGPNNEGKSNILRALVTSMGILSRHGVFGLRVTVEDKSPAPGAAKVGPAKIPTRLLTHEYEWSRDFPVHLQAKDPGGKSVFVLESELSEDEVHDFRADTGSLLNGTLPIQISLNDAVCEIKVVKKGPGGDALTKKSSRIARFVSSRIGIQYIPAVRTAKRAIEVVEEMVSEELAVIEENPEFQAALKTLERSSTACTGDPRNTGSRNTLEVHASGNERFDPDPNGGPEKGASSRAYRGSQ
jgi:hypothetical protein